MSLSLVASIPLAKNGRQVVEVRGSLGDPVFMSVLQYPARNKMNTRAWKWTHQRATDSRDAVEGRCCDGKVMSSDECELAFSTKNNDRNHISSSKVSIRTSVASQNLQTRK